MILPIPLGVIWSSVIFSIIEVVILFLIGVLLRVSNPPTLEYQVRYDDKCSSQVDCVFAFEVRKRIESPVYLYLYFKDFFVHHRKMARSKSEEQLSGEYLEASDLEEACEPKLTNNDAQFSESYTGEPLIAKAPLVPCGIYPYYFPQGRIITNQK